MITLHTSNEKKGIKKFTVAKYNPNELESVTKDDADYYEKMLYKYNMDEGLANLYRTRYDTSERNTYIKGGYFENRKYYDFESYLDNKYATTPFENILNYGGEYEEYDNLIDSILENGNANGEYNTAIDKAKASLDKQFNDKGSDGKGWTKVGLEYMSFLNSLYNYDYASGLQRLGLTLSSMAKSFQATAQYPAEMLGQGIRNILTGDNKAVSTYSTASGAFKGASTQLSRATAGMTNTQSFLWNTGVSIANNIINMMAYGWMAFAAPEAGVGAALAKNAVALAMSAQAGSRAAYESAAKGGTYGQSLAMGALSGGAEFLGEKLSIERLFKNMDIPAATAKEIFKKTLQQFTTEASEEMLTETMNIFSDVIVMKDKSDMVEYFNNYLAKHPDATHNQAILNTFAIGMQQVLEAGLAGGISGVAMGGTTQLANKAGSVLSEKTSDKTWSEANKAATSKQAYQNIKTASKALLDNTKTQSKSTQKQFSKSLMQNIETYEKTTGKDLSEIKSEITSKTVSYETAKKIYDSMYSGDKSELVTYSSDYDEVQRSDKSYPVDTFVKAQTKALERVSTYDAEKITEMAKDRGLNVVWYSDEDAFDKQFGFFDTNTDVIYINTASPIYVYSTFTGEYMHWLAKNDKKLFNKFAQELQELSKTNETIKTLFDKLGKAYKGMDEQSLLEEQTAHAIELLFFDRTNNKLKDIRFKSVEELFGGNKTLLEKLRGILKTIKRNMQAKNFTKEAKEVDNIIKEVGKVLGEKQYITKDVEKKGKGIKESKPLTEDGENIKTLLEYATRDSKSKKTDWKVIQEYQRTHPEYNFVMRLYKGDSTVKEDLTNFLEQYDDVDFLNLFSWYWAEAIDEGTYSYGRWVSKYAGEFRKFRNIVAKRVDALRAEKIGGISIEVKKNTQYSIEDIRKIFDKVNKNPDLALLADKVFAKLEEPIFRDVKIFFSNDKLVQGLGGISAGRSVVYKESVFKDAAHSNEYKAQTIVHELIHSITSYALRDGRTDPNSPYRNAYLQLEDTLNMIKADYDFYNSKTGKWDYGTTDVYELVAELSNEKFVEKLKKRNLLQRIIDAIKSIFGIETKTAYDSVNSMFEYIIDNPSYYLKEQYDYRNQLQKFAIKDAEYSNKVNSNKQKITKDQETFFEKSAVKNDKKQLLVMYHGTDADFYTFDRNRIGLGTDQFGAGYYFAEDLDAAKAYGKRIIETYLNITNPIVINRSLDGGDLFDVAITQTQAYKILKEHPLIMDKENSPLGDFVAEYWEQGPKDWMIREMAKNYTNLGALDADRSTFRNYPNELHEAIKKVLGYDGVEVRFDNTDKKFYVAWFENQIKETSNLHPTDSIDIRFSRSLDTETLSKMSYEELDNVYAENIANFDGENLRRIVDQVALRKGILPLQLYHGTGNFGFTKFDSDKLDDKFSFFFSSSRKMALSYTSGFEKRDIYSSIAEYQMTTKRINEMSSWEFSCFYDFLTNDTTLVAKDYDANIESERYNNELDLSAKANETVWADVEDGLKDLSRIIKLNKNEIKEKDFIKLNEVLDSCNKFLENDYKTKFFLASSLYKDLRNMWSITAGYIDFKAPSWSSQWTDVFFSVFTTIDKNVLEITKLNLSIRRKYEYVGSKEVFIRNNEYVSKEELLKTIEKQLKNGVYNIYLDFAGKKYFILDGGGNHWDKLIIPDDIKDDFVKQFKSHEDNTHYYMKVRKRDGIEYVTTNTRTITRYAKENGYDGVLFQNIIDSGDSTAFFEVGNVYVTFNPNDIKSSDLVTYDDDGMVIPVSQRFDTSVNEVRYSKNVDSDGMELTQSQSLFFELSKVRDDKGNLMRVYHGTRDGNFFVFDANKLSNSPLSSQIEQGFYFTNVREEAKSYATGRDAQVYTAYLNITNPFEIGKSKLNIEKAKQVYMAGNYDWFINNYIPFLLGAEVSKLNGEQKIDKYLAYLKTDKEILQNMVRAYKFDNQAALVENMKSILGIDGIVEKITDNLYQYVALSSNQIKTIDNKYPTLNDNIKFSKATDEEIIDSLGIRLSRGTEEENAVLRKQFFKAGVSTLSAEELNNRMAEQVAMWDIACNEINSEILDKYNAKTAKDQVWSVFKKQSGYKYNMELSTMCVKGVPLFDTINTIVASNARDLLNVDTIGRREKVMLYGILKQHGFTLPCAICYVEQKRQNEGRIINEFLFGREKTDTLDRKYGWNEVLDMAEKSMKKQGIDYKFTKFDKSITTENYQAEDVNMTAEEQDAFFNALADIVNDIKGLTGKDKVTKENIQGNKNTKGRVSLNLALIRTLVNNPECRHKFNKYDLYSSYTMANLTKNYTALYELFNHQGGIAGYKTKQGTEIYAYGLVGSHISPDRLKLYGGYRLQSNSDTQMISYIDMCQILADASLMGFTMHEYTKVLASAKLFGLSGLKVNMSLIPAVKLVFTSDGKIDYDKTSENAGLDKNGEVIYDDIEGINHLEALMLAKDKNYSKNCSCVCIGYSKNHIWKLLDADGVEVIIGYHDTMGDVSKRYIGAKYAFNFNNNSYNETTKINNAGDRETLTKAENRTFSSFLAEAEKLTKKGTYLLDGKAYGWNDVPRLAAQLYLNWCAAPNHNYTPMYADFTEHENYYKLLADFTLYDSEGNYAPQEAVKFYIPDQVPYLNNGVIDYQDTQSYIHDRLSDEITIRQNLADALTDMTDDGIIPQFIKEANKTIKESRSLEDEELKKVSLPAMTIGEMEKRVSEQARPKVYNKNTTNEFIKNLKTTKYSDDLLIYSAVKGKLEENLTNILWANANRLQDAKNEEIMAFATAFAEEIIDRAYIEDNSQYDEFIEKKETAETIISVFNKYKHGINLTSVFSDLKYEGNEKKGITLMWHNPKAEGFDKIIDYLNEDGIYFSTGDTGEAFKEFVSMYKGARKDLKPVARKMLTRKDSKGNVYVESWNQQIYNDMVTEIAGDVFNYVKEKGYKSEYAKRIKAMNDRILGYKADYKELAKRAEARNDVDKSIRKLGDTLKNKEYSGVLAPFEQWTKSFLKSVRKENCGSWKTREVIYELLKFYNPENIILNGGMDVDTDTDMPSYFDINLWEQMKFVAEEQSMGQPLTGDEIYMVNNIIKGLNALFRNYDIAILNGRRDTITNFAKKANAMAEKQGKNKLLPVISLITDPRVVVREMERYNPEGILTQCFNDITRGETEASYLGVQLMMPINEYIENNKTYRKHFFKDKINFAGQELSIGNAISIYMSSLQRDGRNSLIQNGFTYWNGKKKVYVDHVAESELDALVNNFTAQDKELIKLVRSALDDAGAYKQRKDIERRGYTNIVAQNYFPLIRDSSVYKDGFFTDNGFMSFLYKSSNQSWQKSRQGSKGQLNIVNVYDMMAKYTTEVGAYIYLADPIETLTKIYYKNVGTGASRKTLASTIERNVWDGAEKYITKLVKDIQGIKPDPQIGDKIFNRLRSTFATYQLGFNLSVFLTQTASYPTAYVDLSASSLAKGAAKRTDYTEMDKYCHYAMVRNYVNGVAMAESVTEKIDKTANFTTKPIQKSDRFTIGKLWNACQYEIEKTQGLAYGSEENKVKAGELLEKVIRDTQPNYVASERSAMMRSHSQFIKLFSMFQSVPLKQISRLVEYSRNLVWLQRSNASAEQLSAARTGIAKTATAITLANIMYVLEKMLVKHLFNKKDEDETWLEDAGYELLGTFTGMIPVVRDLYGYFKSDYELSNFAFESIKDLLDATKSMGQLIISSAKGETVTIQETMKALKDSIYALGQFTGLPTRNVYNFTYGMINRFSPETAYKINDLFYQSNYTSDAQQAIEDKDMDLAKSIIESSLKDKGIKSPSTSVVSETARLMKAGYNVTPTKISTTDYKEGVYNRMVNYYSASASKVSSLISSSEYKALTDEQKAKSVKFVYDCYYDKAMYKTGQETTDAETYKALIPECVDVNTYSLAYAYYQSVEAKKTSAGNLISGSKKSQVLKYINSLGIEAAERYFIIAGLGYTLEDSEKTILKRYIKNLNITDDEKTLLINRLIK